MDNGVPVVQYRVADRPMVLVSRRPGRWRRYTWRCLDCPAPYGSARFTLTVAFLRSWRHSVLCRRST